MPRMPGTSPRYLYFIQEDLMTIIRALEWIEPKISGGFAALCICPCAMTLVSFESKLDFLSKSFFNKGYTSYLTIQCTKSLFFQDLPLENH